MPRKPLGGKPGRKPRFTVDQVAKALELSGGIPNRAAKRLKCDWHTVMEYIRNYPQLELVISDAKEVWLDDSEDQLRTASKKGEPWAVKFTLERLGAERGWAEKRELSGRGGAPLTRGPSVVVIQVPDNGRDQPMIQEQARIVLPAPDKGSPDAE